jgi:hypothetical protein
MSSVELKMAFNEETGEVETLVDGEVLISSGKEEFESWVNYYNEKNPPVQTINNVTVVTPPETPAEPPVDSATGE